MIDIKGLNKAKLLAALYNHTHPQGMGFLQYDPKDMTEAQAQNIIDELTSKGYSLYFDYLKGRVMKVDITGTSLDERLFDRDNLPGAANAVVQRLRKAEER
jgi:hypothetical protein